MKYKLLFVSLCISFFNLLFSILILVLLMRDGRAPINIPVNANIIVLVSSAVITFIIVSVIPWLYGKITEEKEQEANA